LLSFRHLIWLKGIVIESAFVNTFGQSADTKGYRRKDSPVNMEAQQPVKHSFRYCQPSVAVDEEERIPMPECKASRQFHGQH
jgi:hypothetical protein